MLPGGTQGEFYSIFSHIFAPARSGSDFPTLTGPRAARAAPAQVWPLLPACFYHTLPAPGQPSLQNQQRIPPLEKKPKLSSARNSAIISRCFMKPCFRLQNKCSPPACDLHASDDVSDTRKPDLVFEYFQTQLPPPHLSLFSKGLFGAMDVLVSLRITPSPGSCRRLFTLLAPPLLTTEQVLPWWDDPSLGSARSQGTSWPASPRHGESVLMRMAAAVISPHPDCHPPQLSLLLLQGAQACDCFC